MTLLLIFVLTQQHAKKARVAVAHCVHCRLEERLIYVGAFIQRCQECHLELVTLTRRSVQTCRTLRMQLPLAVQDMSDTERKLRGKKYTADPYRLFGTLSYIESVAAKPDRKGQRIAYDQHASGPY